MDLEAHSDEELRELLKVKYGRSTFPADITVLKQCPISRELIVREWIADKVLYPLTTGPNIEHRFKEVERVLNIIVSELRTPKTYTSSYTPTYTLGGVHSSYSSPSSYTQPAVLTNPALPITIII